MFTLRSASSLHSVPRAVRLPRPQIRHFHPTKPASFSVINLALDTSSAFIHGVHTVTFLPWVLSIPLTAVIVRTFIAFPLQIFTKFHASREKRLQPLLQSWAVQIQEKTRMMPNVLEAKQAFEALMKKRTKELHRRWGISTTYRPVTILQLPVFLTLMESLRGMCGNNNGILLWILSRWEGSMDPAQASESLHLTIEPSLAAEGALWFPDLLAGDSTGILPVILTASILHNVTANWKKKSFQSVSDLPSLQMYKETSFIGLRYFIQVMAVYVGAASFFSQMPVALMLYWITSTNTATLQSWYLENRVFNERKLKTFEKKYIAFEKKGVEDPFQLKNLR
ncbi:hypothetical protein N7499_007065 [Penicillium canescens]|uniref:Membrane insertase YidC/Oxa/ALB C-terminal domain-containing protein n=1 Tax=Penicillium canescens TaxID=5083 RepID=A0AAD6IEP9_PENCN|nr:uncharacterized protein N7446_002758 [Penicillium canescens]KAJ6044565.1 hypothetical protein N7460_005920 [Penicillium canescens]KAJ6056034.1 hypothetical protein N7444_005132 [Penicillium canescens]KAJ6074981.1 hypothetical protein N7446_002758 [Penicillium canescens]KAJ6082191.1 hypothetical protein N7499_007065 [Penicillium canescens]KAJ6176013.1 hypothetical protein N7485_002927 [Penicillium canescens]